MVDHSPYVQDLRRYARVWSRLFPALVFWCNAWNVWEMMLAPPRSRVRLDRGDGVTSQKLITLHAAWLGATRELIRYQQALALCALMIPFNSPRRHAAAARPSAEASTSETLGAATRSPYSGPERTAGLDRPAAARASSVTPPKRAAKGKRARRPE